MYRTPTSTFRLPEDKCSGSSESMKTSPNMRGTTESHGPRPALDLKAPTFRLRVRRLVFGAGLAVVAAIYFWTRFSHTILFWAAFVLNRPLGATVGDLIAKPVAQGGLHFSRLVASFVLLGRIVACVALIPQPAATKGDAA